MSKKMIFVFVLIALVSIMLTACGTGNSSANNIVENIQQGQEVGAIPTDAPVNCEGNLLACWIWGNK